MGSNYTQLSIEERRRIERWRHARVSLAETARVLGRHRSTIFRERRRNHFVDRCLPKVVGDCAMAARSRTADRQRKLMGHDRLRASVEGQPKPGRTPERIAGRMRTEGARPRACHSP